MFNFIMGALIGSITVFLSMIVVFCTRYSEQDTAPIDNNNRCVICGEIIPEGRQICPKCEKSAERQGLWRGMK